MNLFFTISILLLLWYVKITEESLGISFSGFGLYPRTLHGLLGVITSPFLHGSYSHLINNSVPFFILTLSLLFFYKNIAFRVLFICYLTSGVLVWIFARPSYHIGASGVVYAEAAFLFFSGVIRRNINLLAISLIVAFLYGSMVWGVFPIDLKISWEGHLFGALVGVVLAVWYRHEGPQPEKPYWMDEPEDDDDDDDEDAYWKVEPSET